MVHNVTLDWQEKMAFETEINGHSIITDAGGESGGENRGPRPKPFMLLALAGCTGMDVISILKKMRVAVDKFQVSVDGELTDEHPQHYHKMTITYYFQGQSIPREKVEKAVQLSQDKYCGVSVVYRKALDLDYRIEIEN